MLTNKGEQLPPTKQFEWEKSQILKKQAVEPPKLCRWFCYRSEYVFILHFTTSMLNLQWKFSINN